MIPAGTYPATVLSHGPFPVQDGKSFRYGINVRLTLLDGKTHDRQWSCGMDSEAARRVLARTLTACGGKVAVETFDHDLLSLPDALPNTVQAIVEHREHEGKTYDEVKYLNGTVGRDIASGDGRRAMLLRALGKQPASGPFGAQPFGAPAAKRDPFA